VGVFAVGPDMAKILALVTLHKTCLGVVCLNLGKDIAEAG